jgi:hypothetical protein
VPPSEEAAQPADAEENRSIWQSFSILFALVSAILVAFQLFRHGCGPEAMLLVAPCILLAAFLLRRFERPPCEDTETPTAKEPDATSALRVRRTSSSVSRAIVQRAWQAALFAAFVFPPLAFYSVKLLWRLGQRDTPLSGADSLRTWLALLIDLGAILFCVAFLAGMLAAILQAFP